MAEHTAGAIPRNGTLLRRPDGADHCDDKDSEAIRQSLEALDQVLDQYEAGSIKSKNVLNAPKVVLRPKDSVREAVYQSLSFLDGVLAEFECEETAITKEQDNAPAPPPPLQPLAQPKHLNVCESGGKIASVKRSPAPSPPGSPLSSPKVPSAWAVALGGPPVPKRSPTTCLSTSSLGGEGPPTPDTPSTLQDNPFPPSSQGDNFYARKGEEESCESSGSLLSGEEEPPTEKLGSRGRKLSSRPVQKGSSRPKLRSPPRKVPEEEQPEDKSSDEVFLNDDPPKPVQPPKSAAMTDIHSEVLFNHVDKFALVRHLLLSGELPGLDELPPSFKPPPPPKSTNNKNNRRKESVDPNGNPAQTVHVTSVKINPDASNPPPVLPPAPPNISVITIQAKNNNTNPPVPATTNNNKTSKQKTDAPQFRKKAFPVNNSSNASTAPASSKNLEPQTSNSQLNNNNNGAEPRLKLSTFNRDLPSPVSSSQEDLCKSNSGSLERKPLQQPEVRNVSGPVFFNVFQSDGALPPDGAVVVDSEGKKEVEVSKKKGWMMRKSKKANNQQATKAKDEVKEALPSDNNELPSSAPPVAVAEKALLAELSGRLRRAPSPPRDKLPALAPPLAVLEDSDEDISEQSSSQQGSRSNKDERSKWKIWRKKEGKSDQ